MRATRLSALLLLLALPGCVIDSVPTPEIEKTAGNPVPGPAGGDAGAPATFAFIPQHVFFSTNGSGPTVLLAGTPWAIPSSTGFVGAENLSSHSWAQRPIEADGSFWLTVDAQLGDVVRLVYFQNGTIGLAEMRVTISPSSAAAVTASMQLAGGTGGSVVQLVTVSTPDAQGRATVTGAAGSVTPGVIVVLIGSAGGATSATADATGAFGASLRAQSGDTVTLFAAESVLNRAGGPLTTLDVP